MRLKTEQVADAIAIVGAWKLVPENEAKWFDVLLRASSIAKTDDVLLRHDFTLTIGIRIARAADSTGPDDMAWFFRACSALEEAGVTGADRLYRLFDETDFFSPCCPECNGYSGDVVDPDLYCSAGRLWSEHPDEQPDDADTFGDCSYRA